VLRQLDREARDPDARSPIRGCRHHE
jgi:hypothetical protein